MKRKIYTAITTFVLLICVTFLSTRGYQWWQLQQKRKALFVYFQKGSQITQRIPEDAILYLNLFDFKRVHAGIQGTYLNDVLAHWLDTGMSQNHQANPLLGGMLETTILNVIGEEFAVSLVPSNGRFPDIFAVAKLASGSDLLLQLALSNSKNIRKIPFDGESIYVLPTKFPDHPELFIHVDDLFAFASSSEERIKKVHSVGKGPVFLADLDVQAIPEDTFLFLEVEKPSIFALLHGGKNFYSVKSSSRGDLVSCLPKFSNDESDIFQIQTNGLVALRQPSATYTLLNFNDLPASSISLCFPNKDLSKNYQASVLSHLDIAPENLDSVAAENMNCLKYPSGNQDRFICIHDKNLVLAQSEAALKQAAASLRGIHQEKLPPVLRIQFRPKHISNYLQMVIHKDWNQFPQAKEFYFLSCIKQIQGSIDGSQNEITMELQ